MLQSVGQMDSSLILARGRALGTASRRSGAGTLNHLFLAVYGVPLVQFDDVAAGLYQLQHVDVLLQEGDREGDHEQKRHQSDRSREERRDIEPIAKRQGEQDRAGPEVGKIEEQEGGLIAKAHGVEEVSVRVIDVQQTVVVWINVLVRRFARSESA